MLRVLCAGHDPLLLKTRGLMLQRAGFHTDIAIGATAAVAAFTARHFSVVVLCHTFTEQERRFLQAQLRKRAPWAHVLVLDHPERALSYSPPDFIRLVRSQARCA